MAHAWKLAPFPHQARVWENCRDRDTYALFWEMGCGKSSVAINIAAHRFLKGEIDSLIVVAPNTVDRNWITDECPAHMPDEVEWRGFRYRSAGAGTKKQEEALVDLGKHRGLGVLAISYDAFVTDRGKAVAKKFLTTKRCMMVLDESHKVKTPGAKRTRAVLGASMLAKVKWILSGTPIARSPIDCYSQMKMLDPDFWKPHGLASAAAMRARFEVIEPRNLGGGRHFNKVIGYRDVDVISNIIAPHSDRVLKADVLQHLPPKLYQKAYFEMTPAQGRVYQQLRDDYVTQFQATDDALAEASALTPMVRVLRLHQVTSGYLPDAEGNLKQIEPPDKNARLRRLLALLEDAGDKQVIIWARFRYDITLICQALGNRAVRYDGEVKENDRVEAIAKFRSGRAQFFVANAAAIGVGVTLTEAEWVVYYNNSFNLVDRLQSEDRAHRIGQTKPVHYFDFVAEGTVDEKIVASLREKRDVAAAVLGDGVREWI